MVKKLKYSNKALKNWPEHDLPWHKMKAAALMRNETVAEFLCKAALNRIKGNW